MIETGNAGELGEARHGWFLGHFLSENDVLHSRDVEIKWAHHRAGERRDEWTEKPGVLSLSILVRGRFTLMFEDREVPLRREGDFAYWEGQDRHTWRCEEDSVIVTVRWPSVGK